MFTERKWRQPPAVIKAFRGLPAAGFGELSEKIKERLPVYELQRLERADRQRRSGGGRDFAHPLVSRVALVLTSRRLHIAQEAVASL
jgi:hypothetical protein